MGVVGVHYCSVGECYAVQGGDAVLGAEVGVQVGAVDVNFAADWGEGDDALVAVVRPCFGRDSEQLSRGF